METERSKISLRLPHPWNVADAPSLGCRVDLMRGPWVSFAGSASQTQPSSGLIALRTPFSGLGAFAL